MCARRRRDGLGARILDCKLGSWSSECAIRVISFVSSHCFGLVMCDMYVQVGSVEEGE